MKWDSSEGYIEYKQALNFLNNTLEIKNLNYVLRTELAPYMTRIIQYVNKKLITAGEDIDLVDKIQLMFDTFDYGANMIVNLDGHGLASEVGVLDTGTETDTDVLYSQDRFIFSWSNFMTSLVERLKTQYASLLYQAPSQGCSCSCANGETWKDFEAYSSGVYPEDEEYSTYDFTGTTTSPYTSTSGCSCGGERMKTEYLSSNE